MPMTPDYRSLTDAAADRPAEAALRRHVRRALLIVPLVAPFVFHALYQPVNEAWTVQQFGCGCPPIVDTRVLPLNANHFNMVLWCGVWMACASSWWFLLRPEFADRKSDRYLVGQLLGLIVLACICFSRLGREIWL